MSLDIFLFNLKRVSVDLGALVLIALLLIFVPESYLPVIAKENLVALFFTKFILVSAGVVHAHITRELLFPYIDFNTEKSWSNNAMVIALYVVIILGWTRGG